MIPRIGPLDGVPDERARDGLDALIARLGYRPNALFTMARVPGLLAPVLQLIDVTLHGAGRIEPALKFLVVCEACRGARCFYSSAHVVHAAHQIGVSWAQLAALATYRTSALFSQRERAAIAIASAGATLPTRPADAAFAEAAEHFCQEELLEIVSVVALFGWFNRWNSLVETVLEDAPARVLEHVPWLQECKRR